MNIAVFVDHHFDSLGGIQTSVRSQCQELVRLGHQVTVICPRSRHARNSNSVNAPGIRFVELRSPLSINGYEFVYPFAVYKRRILRELGRGSAIDVVHAHTNLGVGVLAFQIAKELDLPLVQSFHGREDVIAEKSTRFPRLITGLVNILHACYVPHRRQPSHAGTMTARNAWSVMLAQSEAADHVTTPSHHFLKTCRDHGLTTSASVVSNALPDGIMDLPIKRAHTGLADPPRIIWVGRLWSEKSPELLLGAAELLPQYSFVMLGNGPLESSIRHTLQSRKIKNLALEESVDQTAVLQQMQDSDLLVQTSHGFDTQSMVLLEAMSVGLPVVICDPNLQETVPVGSAVLVEPNVQALAHGIDKSLSHPGRLNKMRRCMLSHRDEIRQSVHIAKLLKVYNKAIHDHKA